MLDCRSFVSSPIGMRLTFDVFHFDHLIAMTTEYWIFALVNKLRA